MNKRYRETDQDRDQKRGLQQEEAERERARQQSGDPRENDESRADRGRQRSQPGCGQSQSEDIPPRQQGGWQSEMEREFEDGADRSRNATTRICRGAAVRPL
jgi:hypothetical protein